MSEPTPAGPSPFDTARHRALSYYCRPGPDGLVVPAEDARATRARAIHDALQARIVEQEYACVGAQAAFNQEVYRVGVYGPLGSEAATLGLARDLYRFEREQDETESDFTTFLAAFDGPDGLDEAAFETALWTQLQRLHDADRLHHGWDPATVPDPTSPRFSYSFAGRAYYVVGMHAASSRPARRFPFPLLAFNRHQQFDRLRQRGVYDKMQRVIRDRDVRLHGSTNPMLGDFGQHSEARQYAGRAVGADWRCPFHATQAAGGAAAAGADAARP